MRNMIEELEVEKISILSETVRPAVRGALVMLAKSDRETDFEKRVADIRKRDNCSGQVALQKARELYPHEFEAYQSAGAVSSYPMQKAAEHPKAVIAFEQLVARIASEEGIPRTAAMRRARQEHPVEFAAYQSA